MPNRIIILATALAAALALAGCGGGGGNASSGGPQSPGGGGSESMTAEERRAVGRLRFPIDRCDHAYCDPGLESKTFATLTYEGQPTDPHDGQRIGLQSGFGDALHNPITVGAYLEDPAADPAAYRCTTSGNTRTCTGSDARNFVMVGAEQNFTDWGWADGVHQTRESIDNLSIVLTEPGIDILYGRLNPGDAHPLSLGPLASDSLHIHGNTEHAGFGVALRNGYAEPWAYGDLPVGYLAYNRASSDSVSWNGTLLGLTPAAQSVMGAAALTVNMGTMAGRADFTKLESWTGAPGEAGTGTMWSDGSLGYTIAVFGNAFRETGGDAGRLTGSFTGLAHEGAAGTLERHDLSAAFGARR